MEKVLVTGGAGFIGSHTVDFLSDSGCQVVVIDNLSTGSRNNINPKAVFYEADICGRKISEIFEKEKPAVVFHYAAQINVRESVKDPVFDAGLNILGSLNILENCKNHGVKKIIFSSSGGAIYGETDVFPTPESAKEIPLSPYAIAKFSVEKYLGFYYKNYGLDYIALRFSNVYGPRQNSRGEAGVVSIFSEKMIKGEQPVIFGTGRQTRDFVYVKDIARAGALALSAKENGIFNLGTGKETDVNTIFAKVNALAGGKFAESHGPAAAGEPERSCLDCSRADKLLGWKAEYSLEQGLNETFDYFKGK